MSVEAMSWVLHHSPTCGTDKVILLGVANHADADGANAWPSLTTLARYARVDSRSVQRALRRLEAAGHLEVEVQAGGHADARDDRRPNRYRIVMQRGGGGVTPCPSDLPRGDVHAMASASRGDVHAMASASPKPSIRDTSRARGDDPTDEDLLALARSEAISAGARRPEAYARKILAEDRARLVDEWTAQRVADTQAAARDRCRWCAAAGRIVNELTGETVTCDHGPYAEQLSAEWHQAAAEHRAAIAACPACNDRGITPPTPEAPFGTVCTHPPRQEEALA